MRILNSDEKMNNAVVALGMFDGLHLGHRALIEKISGEACAAAVTFRTHPREMIYGKPVLCLASAQEKLALLSRHGVNTVMYLEPMEDVLNMNPRRFFDMLCERLSPKRIVVGYNYRFGKDITGDVFMLSAMCAEKRVELEVIPPVMVDGEAVSSTKIRDLILNNDIETANKMLGYDYSVTGRVIHGKKIGGAFGVPTVNLRPAPNKCLPNGVFAGHINAGGKFYKSVINVGTRPTVADENVSIEANILDFNGDIYENMVEISLVSRIRGIKKFESLEELFAQIRRDIEYARGLHMTRECFTIGGDGGYG